MSTDILIQNQKPGNEMPCPECGTVLNITSFNALDPLSCPNCGTTMIVPAELGHYLLHRQLGEGAMGRVYQATDRDLERDVAVKILRKDIAATPRMWTMLEKEARAAAGISHNNVIRIYNMGKVLGRPYIVMELADFASLEEWMAESPLKEPMAVNVAIDVLQGLKAAAEAGLLHGDIKPANIIITSKQTAKVADFGLSRFLERETEVQRWGTPYYMPPEKSQAISEDIRSDMYSLGATLFHLTAGRAPFEGTSGEEVIEKALKDPTPHLHKVAPHLSRGFSDIVYRMMQRNPDDRFDTYDDALNCFIKLRDGTYRKKDARRPRHKRDTRLHHMVQSLSRLVMDE